MLPKDVFEASFLLLSRCPKRVSKEIANTFNWKTIHYSWLKPLLNPLSSPFHLYGGNLLPPQLTEIALFQHTVPDTHKFPLDARIRIASHARIRIASHRMRGNARMCEHSHRMRENARICAPKMRTYVRIRIACAHMRAFASHVRKCAHYDAKDA